MVDIELLVQTVDDSGIPVAEICRRAGMKRETYYNKLDNPDSFKVPEIVGLSRALSLTKAKRDAIFFSNKPNSNAPDISSETSATIFFGCDAEFNSAGD